MTLRPVHFWCSCLLLLPLAACGPMDDTTPVATQDITFGSPAPAVTDLVNSTPRSADQPTVTFTIQNVATQNTPVTVNVTYGVSVNGTSVGFVSTVSEPVAVLPNSSQAVSLLVPAPGSAGSYVYTITLISDSGTDSNVNNNSASIIYTITAGN